MIKHNLVGDLIQEMKSIKCKSVHKWRQQFFIAENHQSASEHHIKHALLYLTDARWIQTFQNARVSTTNMHDSEHSMFVHNTLVALVKHSMNDMWWTVKELPSHTGIPGSPVLWI